MSFVQHIAYNIKFFREQKNLTQQELANLLMVARSSIAKWESFQTVPDIETLIRLSEIFEVTLDHLVGKDTHHRELLLDFKRIYAANSDDFDEEAVKLMEYIMRFPDFKQLIYRLEELPIKRQLSIHKILENIIDEYEQF